MNIEGISCRNKIDAQIALIDIDVPAFPFLSNQEREEIKTYENRNLARARNSLL